MPATNDPVTRPVTLSDLDAYDFALPESAVAQEGLEDREAARLFVLDRARPGASTHARVADLSDFLEDGDVLVTNTSRVRPARLTGRKQSGGHAQALLLGPASGAPRDEGEPDARYRALVGCRGKLRVGLKLLFEDPHGQRGTPVLEAEVVALGPAGEVTLAMSSEVDPYSLGQAPLPPYIRRDASTPERVAADLARYQTVYAEEPGSVAAPTAGLHFTPSLLGRIRERGVSVMPCTLHVGPGTFRPLGSEQLSSGSLHTEHFDLPRQTVKAIAEARAAGKRVVAVGTTTTRVLESCLDEAGKLVACRGETDLFLRPGDSFRVVDALLTNFHLPRSSLLMLVAAFAGRETILGAYREAVERGYRFYSYGDAMLIV